MKIETKCQHRHTVYTEIEPYCLDCESSLGNGPYFLPGAFLLMSIYDAFEQGTLTDTEAAGLIEKLGYTSPSEAPEQTKNPS